MLARAAALTLTSESGATASRSAERRRLGRMVSSLQETSLRCRAESYFGAGIEPSELEAAKAYAERKLALIIEREGDAGGARRQSDYLAQLIAETVKSERLARELNNIMELQGQRTKKNSYMFCDTLDMCFFYTPQGVPQFAYAGYASAASPDITEGKLIEAFKKAGTVLRAMKRLAGEEVE